MRFLNDDISKGMWPWPLTFWPWKWCPSHLCANFSLLMPLCSWLRPDVRDKRQTDRRQTDIQVFWMMIFRKANVATRLRCEDSLISS